MSKREIPESWALANLDEVTDINPKHKDLEDNLDVGFVPMSSVSEEGFISTFEQKKWKMVKKGYTHFQDNDVIFAKITPCMENKKSAVVIGMPNSIGCGSTEFHVFRHKRDMNPFYILNFLRSSAFLKDAERNMTGSAGQKRVPTNWISGTKVPVPPALEQARIVQKINSTLEKVKSIEASISKADELIEKYREALLQKAFRGQLVPQNPKAEPASKLIERIRTEREKQSDGKKNKKNEFKPINADEIPFQIPSNWCWVRLSQVASDRPYSFVDGPFGSNLNSKHYIDKGIPVLHSGSVAQGYFRTGELKHFVDSKTFKELERSAVYPGDIVIAKIGANYGGSAIVPKGQFEVGLLSGNTMKLTVSDQLALTDFVAIYLWFLKKTQGFENIVKKTAQPALTLGGMKSLLFPLPPLNEQQRIIEQISSSIATLSKLKGYIDALTSSTIKIKESVLQNAFSGKLVAQKPEEGSGKELLKDILVQRSSDKTVNGIERKRQKPK